MATLIERVSQRHMEVLSSVTFASMGREALVFPREFHLPPEVRGQSPEQPPGTDLFIWKWESVMGPRKELRPLAIVFSGKSNKPLWFHSFRSEADRQRAIDHEIASSKARVKTKVDKAEARKNFQHGFQVGDILYASWGYDQTNVDFYQVTDVKGKEITVREIGARVVSSTMGSDKVMAEPHEFIGPPLRKRPQGQGDHVYVKIDDVRTAHEWEGNPLHTTAAGFGH